MTMREALAVLIRRWVVVLVGGILSVAACLLALDSVAPSYQANANILMVLSQQATGRATPTNPLLNLQDGLATTASVVGNEIMTEEVIDDLADQGYDAEYTVSLVPGAGPLINITALDDDPRVAQATRNALIDEVNQRLGQLQDRVGTPTRQRIGTTTSDIGAQPLELAGNRVRALAGTAALGLLLTLLVAFALDPVLRRLKDRRAANSARRSEEAGESDPASQDLQRGKGEDEGGSDRLLQGGAARRSEQGADDGDGDGTGAPRGEKTLR